MPEDERSKKLLDPELYFQDRFQELFSDPFNLEAKPAVRYRALLERIPAIKDADYCLDLGCGPGLGTWMISKSAKYVLGVDSTLQAVEFAKKHYQQPGKIEFMVRDITDLKLDREFDRAVLVHTLEHLPPQMCVPFLQGIRKLLKPKGMLHISVPAEASLVSRYERLMQWMKGIPVWDPTHLCKFTIPALLRLSRKAGFGIHSVDHGLYPSKKITQFARSISLPGRIMNSITVEAFLSLVNK